MLNRLRPFTKAITLTLAAATLGAPLLMSNVASAQTAPALPGKGKTVTMARGDWDTGWFHAAIYRKLVQKLGYTVNGPVTLSTPPFYTAVGQGDVDFWVNSWFPMHDDYKTKLKGTAEEAGVVVPKGAVQGFIVDKAAVKKFGLKTLADFKRPEVKKAFDRNGDGKADFVGCQLGWTCEEILQKKIKSYGLQDDLNVIKAKYAASFAAALTDYQAGKHVLLYAWMPNWTFSSLKLNKDVVWIPAPKLDSADQPKPVADIDGCITNPCRLGYAANDIAVFANDKFLKANPALAELFKEVHIPVADINAQNAAMNDGDDDVDAQATKWISAHEKTVDHWISDAIAAGNS